MTSDRKSTRLNSSHSSISYAVFCLKNKNQMPVELDEQSRKQQPQRRCHVAAMRLRLPHPIADGACLHDAAAHIVKLDFFFNDTATTEIYTLSLHDALPI